MASCKSKLMRFVDLCELMDILCVAGTLEQDEQPLHPFNFKCTCPFNFFRQNCFQFLMLVGNVSPAADQPKSQDVGQPLTPTTLDRAVAYG
eukprot:1137933-Pelagomonas_calceolata.AAC.1